MFEQVKDGTTYTCIDKGIYEELLRCNKTAQEENRNLQAEIKAAIKILEPEPLLREAGYSGGLKELCEIQTRQLREIQAEVERRKADADDNWERGNDWQRDAEANKSEADRLRRERDEALAQRQEAIDLSTAMMSAKLDTEERAIAAERAKTGLKASTALLEAQVKELEKSENLRAENLDMALDVMQDNKRMLDCIDLATEQLECGESEKAYATLQKECYREDRHNYAAKEDKCERCDGTKTIRQFIAPDETEAVPCPDCVGNNG
jgi:hypothetical protein